MATNQISRCIRIFASVLSLCLVFSVSDIYASRIVTHKIESTAIAGNKAGVSSTRSVEVYLPDGYDNGKHSYPVIYWVPGWGSGAAGSTYQNVLDDAIESGKITPTIAVFIDVHEGISCLNSTLIGNWEDFMVSELISFIDKTYPTIQDPKARGLGGHSMGGYTALILPVLHPNVWGSIGMNDPSSWLFDEFTIDEADYPAEFKSDFAWARSVFSSIPDDINKYNSTDIFSKILLQVGASFSPNPDSPILCDMPFNTQTGDWNQDARDKWNAYNLMDADVLSGYSSILKDLLSITIVVPAVKDLANTNSIFNIYLMGLLESIGISTTRLDMPGDHGTDTPGRFIAITEQLLKAMQGSGTSVSSQNKLSTSWGMIKAISR